MKIGDLSKVELYFVGIKSRLEKNADYFLSIECIFKSGKKDVLATFKNGVLDYLGTKKDVDATFMFDFFKEEAQKYEQSEFLYNERGNSLSVLCGAKGVTFKQFEKEVTKSETVNPLLKDKEYLINIDKARDLLRAIGILTKDYKLKNDNIRKYNQIDRFVELVAPMYENEKGEIVILDCACGKSYLSFVMNYYLRDVLKKKCKIIGIDIRQDVVDASNKIKDELGYHNMEFIKADLRQYEPPANVTGVISLHACDIATDLALKTAIKAKAKNVACVPCCHKELLGKYETGEFSEVFKHGIFKARFNDIFTDGFRALKLEASGYKVNVLEYISPLDTPKNILIRAEKVAEYNEKAENELQKLISNLGIYPEILID